MATHTHTQTPKPAAPAYEIVRAQTPEEVQQCLDIRIAVFHTEQGYPLDTEIDDYDADAETAHFLLRLVPSLEPVGTIRAAHPHAHAPSPSSSPSAPAAAESSERETAPVVKLTRLAVLAQFRAYRLGAALVRALHAYAADIAVAAGRAGTTVVCHSQVPAMGFYARLGYTAEGEEFDEDGGPHRRMRVWVPVVVPAASAPALAHPASAPASA